MADDVRVVVTGIGPVSPIGIGRTDYCTALLSGRSGAGPIRSFDTEGFEHSIACEVKDLAYENDIGRASQFACKAARLALSDAGLSDNDIRARRAVIYIGTTDGESQILDNIAADLQQNSKLDQGKSRMAFPLNIAYSIGEQLGLYNVDIMTIATACSAGNYTVGAGYDAIQAGDADFAIVGGADAICRKTFTGFYRLGTVAPERCQPFDRNRKGILTAEGAGVLVLESLDSALERNARIYAEVAGYALNCDAQHAVAPDVAGVCACITKALSRSSVEVEDVDFVSAHGTGTRANDVTEYKALSGAFGAHLPPVVSVKSMLGHTMGASSALALIGCVLAIEKQIIPPTINFEEHDPECPVDCVPNQGVQAKVSTVVNDGLAFGGNNSVVVLQAYS